MSSFEFKMRAVEKDPSGYYYPRWDQAENITVKAKTKDEAIEKAEAVLGSTGPRDGWPWIFTVDDIQEHES